MKKLLIIALLFSSCNVRMYNYTLPPFYQRPAPELKGGEPGFQTINEKTMLC